MMNNDVTSNFATFAHVMNVSVFQVKHFASMLLQSDMLPVLDGGYSYFA